MPVREIRMYDPWDATGEKVQHISGDLELRDKALTALAELRGEMRIKQMKNGNSVPVSSGFAIKAHPKLHCVPIIHRKLGIVRHINFTDSNPGAESRMKTMLEGNWRFATPEEEQAAIEKWEAERQAIKAEREKALRLPAELMGERMAATLGQFVDKLATRKTAKE